MTGAVSERTRLPLIKKAKQSTGGQVQNGDMDARQAFAAIIFGGNEFGKSRVRAGQGTSRAMGGQSGNLYSDYDVNIQRGASTQAPNSYRYKNDEGMKMGLDGQPNINYGRRDEMPSVMESETALSARKRSKLFDSGRVMNTKLQ